MRSGATTSGGGLGPLFEGIREPARKTDPQTSKDAARHMKESGQINAQAMETLRALRRYIDDHGRRPTSNELCQGNVELRFRYARRLPELEKAGLVRRLPPRVCHVTDRRAHTWEPV